MTASYKALLLPSSSSGRDQPHSDAGMKPKAQALGPEGEVDSPERAK